MINQHYNEESFSDYIGELIVENLRKNNLK
jgi:hypothetical protein